ncbi:MAG: SPOR domain-containing protein [Rhodoferax sp.]|uniref:SPOR domain-containing protein n=1 Tax=Rhodoferax sp. TaxID=50421 RepID=UPI0017CE8D24|nr:SPOR domain-containing protein [Rhodoferax sp.]NMM13159.1 SPOR domain-containing protein [Rhodoferax sp.]
MAFFKFRKSGDEQSATPVQPESVEAMRKRAKYRLIGAAVLVLVGVIGFPLLFDKQPRPISVDLPIEIPDKNKVKPLSIPAPAAMEAVKPESVAPVLPAAPVPAAAALSKKEEIVTEASVAAAPEAPKVIAKAEPKVTEKPVVKAIDKPAEKPAPAVKPVAKADDSSKAQALLDGKEPTKKADASAGRFVVQVGAFSDVARAREARLKLEHAGLKTYTQVAETKDGSRIRVRVGPFADKAEADKAAQKIKKLDLPASVLTL